MSDEVGKIARARPGGSKTASQCVVLVDVINAFDFPGSQGLVRAAERAALRIERLTARARLARVPIVYVNDNFGQWRSDFGATVEACLEPHQPGRRVTARLRPHDGDFSVLKPQHSGFYCTTLEPLLMHLGARTLLIAGFATNLCVLFTANDAYMRGYDVVVPMDCTASNTAALTRAALAHVSTALGGKTVRSSTIVFPKTRSRGKPRAR